MSVFCNTCVLEYLCSQTGTYYMAQYTSHCSTTDMVKIQTQGHNLTADHLNSSLPHLQRPPKINRRHLQYIEVSVTAIQLDSNRGRCLRLKETWSWCPLSCHSDSEKVPPDEQLELMDIDSALKLHPYWTTSTAHGRKHSFQICAGTHRGFMFCLAPGMFGNKHFL